MKFVIVDDHPVVREGIAAILQRLDADTEILEAKDGSEGLLIAERHTDIKLILLGLEMPGSLKGFQLLLEFNRRHPRLPVIVLSSSENHWDVRNTIAAGALGYVPKSASPHVLISAIRLVLNGDLYVPPLILAISDQGPRTFPAVAAPASVLTVRQIEILEFVSQGKTNKWIARHLGLSEKTIKAHLTAMFKALNVANRTEAAATARGAGLV